MEKIPQSSPESKIENQEKGANVELTLRVLRHGERTAEGELTDYGRVVTKEKAEGEKSLANSFNAVKAVGSNAGPKGPNGMGRALETADIYAKSITEEAPFNTRKNIYLSYESLKSVEPFDWKKIYEDNIPNNFDTLSDEEKSAVSKKAQSAVINHLFGLKTEAAKSWIKEIAGALSAFVVHYSQMTKHLKSNSKVLLPSGTHGGMIEPFLREVLIRRTEDNKEIRGFQSIEEAGGAFDPSESFDIKIETDEQGKLKSMDVSFENPVRFVGENLFLDGKKIVELAEHYKKTQKS